MATDFRIGYVGTATPIEKVTLSDGTETSSVVNSNVDRVLSAGIEKSMGSVKTNIGYGTDATATSGIDMTNWSIDNVPATVKFLFMRIVSAVSSGTPDVYISLDNGSSYPVILSGVGDFALIPISLASTNIYMKSSGATTLSNVEILVGG